MLTWLAVQRAACLDLTVLRHPCRDLTKQQLMRYVVTSAQLLHFTGNLTFISQIKGDVKEPTLLFEKSRESFLSGVVYISHVIHIMGYEWGTVSSSMD